VTGEYIVFSFIDLFIFILRMGKFWRLAPMWVVFLTKEDITIELIRVWNLALID